jgi:hypothetical protein
MVEKRNVYRSLEEKPEAKKPLGDNYIIGWTILRWVLQRQNEVLWTGLV